MSPGGQLCVRVAGAARVVVVSAVLGAGIVLSMLVLSQHFSGVAVPYSIGVGGGAVVALALWHLWGWITSRCLAMHYRRTSTVVWSGHGQ